MGPSLPVTKLRIPPRCRPSIASSKPSAEMAGVEYLLIDEHTTIPQFKKELHWNQTAYLLTG